MSTKKPKSPSDPKDLLEEATKFIAFDSANPPVPPMDELSRRRLITGAIDILEEEKRIERYRRTGFSQRILLLTGTAAILVAAVTVFLLTNDSGNETKPESTAPQEHLASNTETPNESVTSNNADLDNESIAVKLVSPLTNSGSSKSLGGQDSIGVGSSIETGAQPLHLEATGRARYRLEAHSKIRVTEVTKDLVECFLDHGEVFVNVDPSKKSPEVIIATPHGRVRVTGTVFTVRVSKDDTEVKVLEGTVAIEGTNSPALEVSSGFQATMSGAKQPTFASRELTQNSAANSVGNTTSISVPDINTEHLTNDEVESAPTEAAYTPSSLLRNAQTLRKQKMWKDAGVAYKIVIDTFPGSVQADIAGVSLAMIQLNHLGQPGEALANLNSYLQNDSQGVLREEASFGRIRAFHALKRYSQELSAIENFRKTFPNSLRIEELNSMLDNLSQE